MRSLNFNGDFNLTLKESIMQYIELANSYEKIIVDDEDYERVKKYRWNRGSLSKPFFVSGKVNGEIIYLTRFVLQVEPGFKSKITFKNGDPKDYRKENLHYVIKNRYPKPGILEVLSRYSNKYETVLFDVEDTDKIKKYSWDITDRGYVRTKIKGANTSLHRYILDYDGEDVVDHIDRNKLNCQKKNLTIVDHSTNNMNAPAMSHNKIGVRGVSYSEDNNSLHIKCQRQDRILRRTIMIHDYDTVENAIAHAEQIYDQFKQELYK